METIGLISIDVLITLTLFWLAWLAIFSENLFNAIVMFILFGLIMALAWVRLNAPDVALAEAALGAGITGAILLETLRKLKTIEPSSLIKCSTVNTSQYDVYLKLFTGLILSGIAFLTIKALLPLADNELIKSPLVFENMTESGVDNPVTAVLLNFRGYDTFLEVFVLYVALLGAWSIGDIADVDIKQVNKSENFILLILIKLLTPILILVAAYILWVGSFKPGGAFQSGSILAGAAVFMALAGWQVLKQIPVKLIRMLVIIGPLYFVSVLVFTTFIEGAVLKYSLEYSGVIIFSIEALSTISIFIILFLLYLGDEIKSNPLEKK